jgi:hypothetical protein
MDQADWDEKMMAEATREYGSKIMVKNHVPQR